MLSANALKLDWSQIVSCGKELNIGAKLSLTYIIMAFHYNYMRVTRVQDMFANRLSDMSYCNRVNTFPHYPNF